MLPLWYLRFFPKFHDSSDVCIRRLSYCDFLVLMVVLLVFKIIPIDGSLDPVKVGKVDFSKYIWLLDFVLTEAPLEGCCLPLKMP